jgi:hypothetical protein
MTCSKPSTFFQHDVEAPGWLTVADLRALLERCPDNAMVCVGHPGHVVRFINEPGAAERFILLDGPEPSST